MRTIYISAEADQRLMQYFRDRGYKVAEISTSGIVSGPVSCHPDMFMCRLGISDDAPLVSFMDLMQRWLILLKKYVNYIKMERLN